ncbi:MAG: hypothetical protein ABJN04_10705 [Hyphomicrobiales bacterium]
MKKLALTIGSLGLSLGILAAPAAAENIGLNADIHVYKNIAELAQEKNGGRNVTLFTTEQAASSFGGFNPRSSLPSTLQPAFNSK